MLHAVVRGRLEQVDRYARARRLPPDEARSHGVLIADDRDQASAGLQLLEEALRKNPRRASQRDSGSQHRACRDELYS